MGPSLLLMLSLIAIDAQATPLAYNQWIEEQVTSVDEHTDYTITVLSTASRQPLYIIVEPCSGCAQVTVSYQSGDVKGRDVQYINLDPFMEINETEALIGRSINLRKGFYSYSQDEADPGTYQVTVGPYSLSSDGCTDDLEYRILASRDLAAYGRPILPANDSIRVVSTTSTSIDISWDSVVWSPRQPIYCVYTLDVESARAPVAIGSACGINKRGDLDRQAGCTIENSFTVSHNLEIGTNYVIEVVAYGNRDIKDDDRDVAYTPVQTRTQGPSAGLTLVASRFLVMFAMTVIFY